MGSIKAVTAGAQTDGMSRHDAPEVRQDEQREVLRHRSRRLLTHGLRGSCGRGTQRLTGAANNGRGGDQPPIE